MIFPVETLRSVFPALQRVQPFIFLDNAAGAQVPQAVLDAVTEQLIERNVQRGGQYSLSRAVDATIDRARANVATFLNAASPDEVAFGLNATSFIRLMTLAIGETLGERNEIIVSDLDHEANVASWLGLGKMGIRFLWWQTRADGCLHTQDLQPLLSPRTRMLACTPASNALGTIVDVRAAADLVHAAGAEIFLDAVHYAPHAPLDVRAMDCDYLVCSGYKIFAPHMGFLWGRSELLAKLPTFRADFIPNKSPDKIEAGTFSFESVAGMDAAVGYIAGIGRTLANKRGAPESGTLRADIIAGMSGIKTYEQSLSLEMLRTLSACGAVVYGITDTARLAERVPTFAFNLPGIQPRAVTEACATANIGIRDGHMYAPRLMRQLGIAVETGVVRASLVHYNTVGEIHRFGNVLEALRAG